MQEVDEMGVSIKNDLAKKNIKNIVEEWSLYAKLCKDRNTFFLLL